MATETKQIMVDLKSIKQELDYIKEHMVDRDMFLDQEEMQLLQESFKDKKEGKLISHEELERELGL